MKKLKVRIRPKQKSEQRRDVIDVAAIEPLGEDQQRRDQQQTEAERYDYTEAHYRAKLEATLAALRKPITAQTFSGASESRIDRFFTEDPAPDFDPEDETLTAFERRFHKLPPKPPSKMTHLEKKIWGYK